MPLPYGEVGNCLKANRLGLGLDADEVANQRGMSRPSAEQIDDLPHVAGKKIDLIAQARVTTLVGKSTPRIEDMDLVRGKARFVGDIQFPDMLHASFVRSPHAHARIDSIDKSAALELPGVVVVLTNRDIRAIAESDRLDVALPDRTYKQRRDRLILATDETVHVGEALAMVLATDAYVAEDAAALVELRCGLLPAVSDCRTALEPTAPRVHSDAPDNLVAAFATGYGDVDAAFAGAR